MSREDDEKEIEATKAPLMEHLIELRSRLIKALLAFALTFVVCFFFAGDIYNILIKPFSWIAGPDRWLPPSLRRSAPICGACRRQGWRRHRARGDYPRSVSCSGSSSAKA